MPDARRSHFSPAGVTMLRLAERHARDGGTGGHFSGWLADRAGHPVVGRPSRQAHGRNGEQ